MESIWSQNTDIAPRERLLENKKTQVAVIGAGMAGILTAYLLQKQGIEVIVLEGNRIGSGQTKNTTAKITAQHGLCYHHMLNTIGFEKTQQYATANLQAIELYKQLVAEEKIDCMLETLPAYLYATTSSEQLKQELDAALKLNIPAEYTDKTSLPFSVVGAVKFKEQAQFHPLQFLKAMSDKLTIYEQTMVTDIAQHTITTADATIQADKIVVATHFPFLNIPGYYFMRMHQERSYVLALENAVKMDGMYYGIDPGSYSFRSSEDYLLFGGGGHRSGENKQGGKYNLLENAARRYYPDAKIAACWSAQDCMTLDGIPYIGNYAASTPDLYVATGFGKWGMTSSMIAAYCISEMIAGKQHPYPVFSPQRLAISESAKMLWQETAKATKGLAKQLFSIPKEQLNALPKGHGGIMQYKEEKVGVYKDEMGEVYFVSIRCPHLGCQLEWNPDEKSWDCPCHGSRFDYKGKLIDNPAMKDIC